MKVFSGLSNKTQKALKYTLFSVITCAIFALSIFFGYLYIYSMQQSLWTQLVDNVTEVSYQGAKTFETYLIKESEIVGRFKRKLTEENDYSEETILEILDTYKDDEGIFSFTLIEPDGSGVIYFARLGYGMDLTKDEVEKLFSSYTSERGVTERYLNQLTGHQTIGYYEKFDIGGGRTGIARKGTLVKDIRNDFSLSFFNDTGFSYIVNNSGDIMMRPIHKNSNRTFVNVFDIIARDNNPAEYIQQLKDNMDGVKSGAMRLHLDGAEYVLAFAPVELTDGWYLMSIIPDSSITVYADEILKSTQSFIVIVAVIIVIVVTFLLVTYFYRKKVSEQRNEVRYREQLFNILVNNTNDVYMMGSAQNYALEYVSPNSERILGIPVQAIKHDIDVLRTDVTEGEGDVIKMIPESGSVSFESERVNHKTGEPMYFVETVYREDIEGNDKFIAVLSDRTPDKKAEAVLKDAMESAQVANMAKSAFLSNMSHDIRTPMNAIIGFTELLKRDVTDTEKVLQYTNKISASGQYLLGLINDVLDMSKIESGKVVLNISEINLADFVEEIAAMIRPQTKSKNQNLEISVFGIKEEGLLGDKVRLNQILINILSNAVKYTPEGGTINFTITELPRINENFAHIRFVVSDNGIGMSEEFQKTIFDPFTRETRTTVNKIQGTGLGMAITKNLVDLMSGSISVESKLGKGSTFTVEIELRIDEEDVNNEFWKEYGISRTLVVDDDLDVCHSVNGVLKEVGLESYYATSGEEATQIVDDMHADGKNFDLILLDMRMPGMNGIETARKIRETVSKETSILILTSYDWGEIEEEAREAGIDAFLPKPFFISNLKLNIKKLKENEKAKEENAEADYTLSGKHFLAAEDNELNSELLVELLDMMGVTCDIAENGQIAVDKFVSSAPGTYDAILMDIQMPVMNGYDATRAIRSSNHPNAKEIPIIAMTANAFAEDINNALEAGMNAHVAKPVDTGYLEKLLKDLLKK